MFVADNGGDWFISGAPDPRWNDDELHAISQVNGSDFEVVDTRSLEPGALLVDAGIDAVLSEGGTADAYGDLHAVGRRQLGGVVGQCDVGRRRRALRLWR